MAMVLGRLALPQSDATFLNWFSGIISLIPHLFGCIMVWKCHNLPISGNFRNFNQAIAIYTQRRV